jgi:hypothetical protein
MLSLKVIAPMLKTLNNSEQFLVVGVVIILRCNKFAQVEVD